MKKVILWILVLSCMSVIFYFSSQEATESKKTSSGFITKIVRFFDVADKITDSEMEIIKEKCTFIVRKGAHFSVYAILGILLYMLLNEYKVQGSKQFVLAILIAFLYSCTDEYHQIFVDGRSGEMRDVFIDSLGAFTGCTIIAFITKKFRRI